MTDDAAFILSGALHVHQGYDPPLYRFVCPACGAAGYNCTAVSGARYAFDRHWRRYHE